MALIYQLSSRPFLIRARIQRERKEGGGGGRKKDKVSSSIYCAAKKRNKEWQLTYACALWAAVLVKPNWFIGKFYRTPPLRLNQCYGPDVLAWTGNNKTYHWFSWSTTLSPWLAIREGIKGWWGLLEHDQVRGVPPAHPPVFDFISYKKKPQRSTPLRI